MSKILSTRLKQNIAICMTAACLAGSSLAFSSNAAFAEGVIKLANTSNSQTLAVPTKQLKTYRTDITFNEIIIGDPDVVAVTPLTDQSFYIVGLKAGTTGIALYNESRELVGNLTVNVGTDTAKLNRELRVALKGTGIKAKNRDGKVVLSGKTKTSKQAAKARSIAKKYNSEVKDTVKVTTSVQVNLEVRFIEAQRSKRKEIGLKLESAKNSGKLGLISGIGGLATGATPFGQIMSKMVAGGANVDLLVQALEEKGLARRLAEPNLVALSGDTASFIAGGELPIPVSGSDGQISVTFKKFGVGLEFTPTVLDNGLINLKIEPEVSAIDTTNSVKYGNGAEIPALVTRRAKSTVELRDGQSFVLAGLLQTSGSYDVKKFPWLGDLPIIGALFRSASYRKNETDLVIIVTPRLVKPLTPGQKIVTPLDATAAPNEVDLFANGKTEINRAKLRKVAQAQEGILSAGHILDF